MLWVLSLGRLVGLEIEIQGSSRASQGIQDTLRSHKAIGDPFLYGVVERSDSILSPGSLLLPEDELLFGLLLLDADGAERQDEAQEPEP